MRYTCRIVNAVKRSSLLSQQDLLSTTCCRPMMAKHAGAEEGKPWIRLVLTLAVLGGLAYVARLLIKAIDEGVE